MVGSNEGHFHCGETANGLFSLAKLAVSFRVGPATWEWTTSFIQIDFQLLKVFTTIWPNFPLDIQTPIEEVFEFPNISWEGF